MIRQWFQQIQSQVLRPLADAMTPQRDMLQTTYPHEYTPTMPIEQLIQMDYWIEAAGNTLEAHVLVPALLPYLNPELLKARAWLRRVRKYISDKDKML